MSNLFPSPPFVVGVVGLGYVGLPLLIALSRKYRTVGFDLQPQRIASLLKGIDETNEVEPADLQACKAEFTTDASRLKECNFVIVAVPTPVDQFKVPDLSPVIGATKSVAGNLHPGATVVYESTVYPGVTEEVCLPIFLEHGHVWKQDFYLGYSPERINPGDKTHRLENIVKIVSGDSPETLERVSEVYESIIEAGVHRASSIKVAEAAKVIENTQRDVNIALMNELAVLFHRLGIDTKEVLEAAGTKWNFLKFFPGLVGGHCIGVDPYYLTYKAEEVGLHPQIISCGRKVNDSMAKFVVDQTIKLMIQSDIPVKGCKILVLGLTFKENVPDTRNSKVADIILELKSYGCSVFVQDPHVTPSRIQDEFEVQPHQTGDLYRVVLLAVPHTEFTHKKEYLLCLESQKPSLFIDILGRTNPSELPPSTTYWRL